MPFVIDYVASIFGNWRRGKAGGFQKKMQNPKYCFTVGDDSKLTSKLQIVS